MDFKLHKRVSTNISGHFWNQPKNYDFNTSESFAGGAIDIDLKYLFFTKNDNLVNAFSIDIGII